ncbi:MAG: DUF4326 domain-containing protein [Pseudonocardia sp.]
MSNHLTTSPANGAEPAGPTGARVRLSRRVGWRKPPGAVVVARPTRWGNPFDWRRLGRAEAVRRHRVWLLAHPDLLAQVRAELAGRVLACWCPLDEPCHADTLAGLAAASIPRETSDDHL